MAVNWAAALGCAFAVVTAGGGHGKPGTVLVVGRWTVETGARGCAVNVDEHGRKAPSSRLHARVCDAPPGDVRGRGVELAGKDIPE